MAGIFGVGYLLAYTVVAPPTNVLGYCPPPAYVDTANNCVILTYHTDSNGKVQSSLQPSGIIIGNVTCTPYHCAGG